MFNQTFNHGVIENYVLIFARLFRDIQIKRRDKEGNVVKTLDVPLVYGYKDQQLAQVIQDKDHNQQIMTTVPIMSFIWDGWLTNEFDSRGLSPLKRIISQNSDDPNKILMHYQAVPYRMSFTLSLLVNKVKDGTQLLEQIIPFFAPDYVITVNLIPGFKHRDDVSIILEGINADHRISGDVNSSNIMTWDLNFSMKVKFYGPVHKSGLIKDVFINYHMGESEEPFGQTEITPGLTESGEPTTSIENSIPIEQIRKEDKWGIIHQFRNL
jgi:hypothetical protein